ncbi:MAG: protease complex subunit PrcB family protein [Bacilli bacterium]|nr:protease complex subunit PrcB family protein [Bacilli bacterium]
MMKNLKKVIIIIVGIIIFLTVITLIIDRVDQKNNSGTSFYYNGSLYKIKPKKLYIKVEHYEIVQCITDPCPPIRNKVSIKRYTKERKELINKIQNQSEIATEELSDNDLDILLEMINEKSKSEEKISYTILESNEYASKYKTRGYYIEENAGKVLVTIAMGEKNTGGYSISITDVEVNNNSATIYIKEKIPKDEDIVTMAFTYPIARIEFNEMPTKISVYNLDNNEEFEKKTK